MRTARRRRPTRYLAEPIEPRRLLSTTLNGGVLTITGTGVADRYTFDVDSGDLVVLRNGGEDGRATLSAVTRIAADLGNGDDSITLPYLGLPTSINGGAGNDTLNGSGGLDTLVGGSGDDSLSLVGTSTGLSGTPAARAEGGDGNDRFVIASGTSQDNSSGSLFADGGAGDDYFDYGNNRDPALDLTMMGGDGDDTFDHTSDDGAARMDGGAGIDTYLDSSIVFTGFGLQAGIENGVFGSALSVSGNELDNHITVNGGRGGQLTVTGGGGDDTIVTSNSSDSIDGGAGNDTVDYSKRTAAITASLTVDYAQAGNGDPTFVGTVGGTAGESGESDALASVETVLGGSAADSFALAADVSDSFTATSGGDARAVGNGGDDQFQISYSYTGSLPVGGTLTGDGGAGDDSFTYLGAGASIVGGEGDDSVTQGDDDSNAAFSFGNGRDTLLLTNNPGIFYTMPADLEVLNTTGFGAAHITGSDGANEINIGSTGGAVVDARGGDDRITVTTGNETPVSIAGGTGNDTITGGNGDDTLDGGAGNDKLVGGRGDDSITGGTGRDTLQGDDGDDTLDGGGDNDILYGGDGDDSMRGAAGNDQLNPGRGDDRVDGGSGGDALTYEGRAVSVTGSVTATLVVGGSSKSVRRDVTASLTDAHVGETDSGTDVEVLTGGDLADTLTASAAPGDWDAAATGSIDRSPLIVNGVKGDDVLTLRGVADADGSIANTPPLVANGGDGNDTLTASDTDASHGFLNGEAGDDVLTYDAPTGYAAVAGGAGDDELRVTRRGADAAALALTMPDDVEDAAVSSDARVDLTGNDSDNRISVDALQSSVHALGGDDRIYGGAGDDSLYGMDGRDKVFAGGGDDRVDGGNGNDVLRGEDGDDKVYGRDGNDNLDGEDGRDSLYGDDGDDILNGGGGRDIVYGNAGTDTGYRQSIDRIFKEIEELA